jgi:hypothetical protein
LVREVTASTNTIAAGQHGGRRACSCFKVDPLLGQAIEAWQGIHPDQPATLDRRTSEQVDLLFSTRARPIGKDYIKRTIIPALCRKASVPTADARGKITSHREVDHR